MADTRERVGLIQIDGKVPNLALMKLASFHRKKGDEVIIIDLSSLGIDRWYGSKIFMGGSGYDLRPKLPADIEIQVPDYELFNTDYSIGFTTRGCFRDCGFCIVKEKEGGFCEVDWKHHLKHLKYVIMDNNFLASSHWRAKLLFFIENKIKVNFNQGLDIRLIDEPKAELLGRVLYYDSKFVKRRIYFAFDDPKIEPIFRQNLELLLKHIPAHRIMIYMLVGHDTSFEQDLHRFDVINSYGCDPFVMIFNNRKDDQRLRDFARWVNRRLYRNLPFNDYKQDYRRNRKLF